MKHSRDKGSMYITVIIILVIIFMLLSMLMTITGRDARTSDLYSVGIRASYIAYSGIARGIAWAKINQDEDEKDKELTEELRIFSSQYPAFHRLEWRVDYSDEDENYTIIATGYYKYNDKITVKRKLKAVVRVQDDLVQVDSLKQIYD